VRRSSVPVHVSAASLVAVAFAATAVGQQPPFRSGVDVVAVDVGVVDAKGRPVPGLGPADFTVKVDGSARRIVTADFVEFGGPAAAPAAGAPGAERSARPRFSTNDTPGTAPAIGRLILIVVDELHIALGGGKAALAAAGRFIDQLTPADRVGLTVLPAGSPSVDFTVNRALVREALGRIVGRGTSPARSHNVSLSEAYAFLSEDYAATRVVLDRECEYVRPDPLLGMQPRQVCESQVTGDARRIAQEADSNTIQSLRALGGLVGALGRLQGPKTLVLLSQALPVGDRPRLQVNFTSEAANLARAAARGSVSIYSLRIDSSSASFDVSVDAPSYTFFNDSLIMRTGLEIVTGMARGAMMNIVGSGDSAFERVALETSAHYLLGVEPSAADRDGRAHRIEVEVARKGYTVRARREFTLAASAESPAAAPRDRMERLLRTFDQPADLPMSVATYVTRDRESGKLGVIIAADIGRDWTAAEEIAVGYLLRDRDDLPAGGMSETPTLQPADRSAPSPLSFSAKALVRPGRYTLRLVAVDRTGRQGVVEHPIDASLTSADRLEFSDLLVAEGATGKPGQVRLSVRGVVRDTLPVYLEVYAGNRALLERVKVRIELSAEDDGPAIASSEAETSLARGGGTSTLSAEGSLPLGLLPPGDYVARAVVRSGDRDVTRLFRPVRIARFGVVSAAAGVSSAALLAGTSVEPFRPADLLEPEVLGHFLDRAEAAVPGERPGEVGRALAAARSGRLDEAAREVSGTSGSALGAFVRGLAAFAHRDLDAAAVQFRAAIKEVSDLFPAVVYLGACYAAGGHHLDAAGAWQMALLTESDQPVLFRLIADAMLRGGDAGGARDILAEALANWPEDESLLRRMAAAHLGAGSEKEAAAALTAYLDRRPDDAAMLLVAIGLLYAASAEGRAIESPDRDFDLATRWAKQYAASGGDRQALVAQWLKYLEQRKR